MSSSDATGRRKRQTGGRRPVAVSQTAFGLWLLALGFTSPKAQSRKPKAMLKALMNTGFLDHVPSPLGWWGSMRTFLSEVRNELKRVTWPSRKEVYATTVVVILTSIFFGVYLFAVDIVFGKIVQWIFSQLG
jgi:preprotein translocase subunit SecE